MLKKKKYVVKIKSHKNMNKIKSTPSNGKSNLRKFSSMANKHFASAISHTRKFGHKHCIPKLKKKNVPKGMGWLWNIPDVPWTPYQPGWKPGAITKKMYKLLNLYSYNNTKQNIDIIEKDKYVKKNKKQANIKKTKPEAVLSVQKKRGNYHINMKPFKKAPQNAAIDESSIAKDKYLYWNIQNKLLVEDEKHLKPVEKENKYLKKGITRSALDKVCEKVHESLNRKDLDTIAKQNDSCHCEVMERQVQNIFMCDCCDCDGDVLELETALSALSNSWSIEYTPASARLPSKKRKITTNKTAQANIIKLKPERVPSESDNSQTKKVDKVEHRPILRSTKLKIINDKPKTSSVLDLLGKEKSLEILEKEPKPPAVSKPEDKYLQNQGKKKLKRNIRKGKHGSASVVFLKNITLPQKNYQSCDDCHHICDGCTYTHCDVCCECSCMNQNLYCMNNFY